MILAKDNDLSAFVEKETNGEATVYLTGTTVSIHWYGATKVQVSRLKILVADYIDRHMLMSSYERINFVF